MLRGKLAPFFQEPCFRVQNPLSNSSYKQPRIIIKADFEIAVALTLAKSGFFSGNPQLILNSSVDLVMQTYHYEIFTRNYEETVNEMNKENK